MFAETLIGTLEEAVGKPNKKDFPETVQKSICTVFLNGKMLMIGCKKENTFSTISDATISFFNSFSSTSLLNPSCADIFIFIAPSCLGMILLFLVIIYPLLGSICNPPV
ncbi:hypothetical protein DXF96_03575 [Heyndrickxia coagulans]|nr:hypothetical protein CYJ15_16100 [Heyndrickxia coagulans]QDI60688.1 hypothetical protein DXF96_03575 [Heyndrickxia coagulans]